MAARIAVVFFALMTLVLSLVLGAVIPSVADEDGSEVPVENAEGSVSTVEPPQTDGDEASTDTPADVTEETSASDDAPVPAVEPEPASDGDVADAGAVSSETGKLSDTAVEEDRGASTRALASGLDASESLADEEEPQARSVRAAEGDPFWCAPGTFYTVESGGRIHFHNGNNQQWDAQWDEPPLDWVGSPQEWIRPENVTVWEEPPPDPPFPDPNWQQPKQHSKEIELNINGFAISPNGGFAYAIQRDAKIEDYFYDKNAQNESIERLRIMQYTKADGWHTEYTWPVPSGFTSMNFVTGAVNNKGEYYFSATKVRSDHSELHLFKYANGTVTKVGFNDQLDWVSGNGANGDIAFDAMGNLFAVHSDSSGNIQILSMSADDLRNAQLQPGSRIPGTVTEQVNTNADGNGLGGSVNGIAFDYDGNVFLGDQNHVIKADPLSGNRLVNKIKIPKTINGTVNGWPVWSKGSTDLASCTAPSTFTLQKKVVKRASNNDQFKLSVTYEGKTYTAETTGTENGLQTETLLIPVKPSYDDKLTGSTYTSRVDFSELMADGSATTDVNDYSPKWECTQKLVKKDGTIVNDPLPNGMDSGTGSSGSIIMPKVQPKESRHVTCTFTNDPEPEPEYTASLKISKVVNYGDGVQEAADGWLVGAVATLSEGSTGEVSADPSGTQTTQYNADYTEASAEWEIKYTNGAEYADITVSETEQTGFVFNHAECTIEPPPIPMSVGSSPTNEPILWYFDSSKPKNNVEHTLTKVERFSTVECTYYNDLVEDLTLIKTDADTGDSLPGVTFQLYKDDGDGAFDENKDQKVGNPQVTTDPYGKIVWPKLALGTYFAKEISAPAGYQLLDAEITMVVDSGEGIENTYTVENNKQLGTVIWQKIDADNNALLAGSEWELKGPDSNTAVKVTDCVTDELTCPADSLDRDPAAGKFKIIDLAWGNYQLIETKAPAGYQLLPESTIPSFEIKADNVAETKDLGQITNEKSSVPDLPLTGGLGSDLFIALGGLCAGSGGLLLGLIWRQRKRAMA